MVESTLLDLKQTLQRPPKVIIIGAGMAGLAAATYFTKIGVPFLILEGSNRVGGRLKSTKWRGLTIELGAVEIQGCSNKNPVWNMAKQLKLKGTKNSDSPFTFIDCQNGKDLSKEGNTRLDYLDKICEKMYKGLSSPKNDFSIKKGLSKFGWDASMALDRAVQWVDIDWDTGNQSVMASYKFNMDEEYTDDDFGDVEHLVDDQRGFETIAIELASKLPSDSISFEQIVKEIVTSQGLVTVKTSGQSYLAPHVILTASIGVLQSGVIKFEPPLPHWKTEAINRFQMTSYLKIFVAWDEQWWADVWFNKDAYVVPVDGSSTEDQWRVFKQVHKDFPILQFTAVGSEAQRVRQLSDQEVKAEITQKLKSIWREKPVNEPIDIFRTQWDSDPLTMGAYSFIPVQSHQDPIGELIKPVRTKGHGTIWFAGEAIHRRYHGYLHSAYLSGQDAATKVYEQISRI